MPQSKIKTHTFQMRISPKRYEILKQLAQNQEKSMANVIEDLLDKANKDLLLTNESYFAKN